jgi:hypothetical protein
MNFEDVLKIAEQDENAHEKMLGASLSRQEVGILKEILNRHKRSTLTKQDKRLIYFAVKVFSIQRQGVVLSAEDKRIVKLLPTTDFFNGIWN